MRGWRYTHLLWLCRVVVQLLSPRSGPWGPLLAWVQSDISYPSTYMTPHIGSKQALPGAGLAKPQLQQQDGTTK